MLVNQVCVFPTTETLDYLNSVFSTCPFDLDFSRLRVILNESHAPSELKTQAVYHARCGTLTYCYSDALQGTSLLLPLESSDLLSRQTELRIADGSVYHAYPLTFMSLVDIMPPLRSNYRTFVASVSDILYGNEQILTFTGESQAMAEIADVYANWYELNGLV